MSKPPLFAGDVQFWYETLRVFGADEYGGSQFGEVLATSARIKPGDYDSWYDAWNATAESDRPGGRGSTRPRPSHQRQGQLSASVQLLPVLRILPARQPPRSKDRACLQGSRRLLQSMRRTVRSADRTGGDPLRKHDAAGLLPPPRPHGEPRADRDHAQRVRRLGGGDACVRRPGGGRAGVQRPCLRRPGPVRAPSQRGPDLSAGLGEGRHSGCRFRPDAPGRRRQADRLDGRQPRRRARPARRRLREATRGPDRQRRPLRLRRGAACKRASRSARGRRAHDQGRPRAGDGCGARRAA